MIAYSVCDMGLMHNDEARPPHARLLAFALLVLLGCERHQPPPPTGDTKAAAARLPPDSTDACARAVRDQLRDLAADTLSKRFTAGPAADSSSWRRSASARR